MKTTREKIRIDTSIVVIGPILINVFCTGLSAGDLNYSEANRQPCCGRNFIWLLRRETRYEQGKRLAMHPEYQVINCYVTLLWSIWMAEGLNPEDHRRLRV